MTGVQRQNADRRGDAARRPKLPAPDAPSGRRPAESASGPARNDRRSLPFVVAIGLSAYLLFTLELLAGRLVLPVFGGTPGVWATTLSFFTAILFAGYLYAHLAATRLSPRAGGLLHLAVAGVAVAATILAPREISALRRPDMPEALNVLLAQALTAGPAAFLLAATTPLLSAWYGRRGHDPWWLYATSNGASFAALVAYPFVLEPLIGMAAQRVLLAAGLAVFAVLLATIVAPAIHDRAGNGALERAAAPQAKLDRRRRALETDGKPAVAEPAAAVAEPAAAAPTLRRRTVWLLVAFVPAGLLSATTNFITTDLLSAPLLWVGPLAIYLLSFVVAFSDRGRRALRIAERLAPAAAVMLWLPWVSPLAWPAPALLLVELGSFLVLAVVLHGRLALDRPDARHLTGFYLVLSAGGMLATGFVALLAPIIFPAIYEYPLLVLAAIAAMALLPRPGQLVAARTPARLARELGVRLLPFGVAALLLLPLVALDKPDALGDVVAQLTLGAIIVAAAFHPSVLAGASLAVIVLATMVERSNLILEERTFFGVLRVQADQTARAEFSGTTLHGFQFVDTARRTIPTTYYVADGPLGQLITDVRDRTQTLRVGIVGLGVGTTAAYARPGDAFTFYEIDAAAVRIAQDPAYFTYLGDAAVPSRVVLGDARLSLADEPDGSFDILILDAFSSDAVPTHLLTREAIAGYVRTLRPGGVLAFHVTNRFYRLESAVVATAQAQGLGALVKGYNPTEEGLALRGALASAWVVAGPRTEMPRYRGLGWGDTVPGPVLTDDFADLLRVFRLGD